VNLISVAGASSRAGKTALAVTLLEAFGPGRAAAVKFTCAEDVFKSCPRGTPCVVCDIEVPFRTVDDPAVLREPGTDTDRLHAAGASRVLWTIAREASVRPAWAAAAARLRGEDLVVMEGSRIVRVARPNVTVFVAHPFLSPERWKPTSPDLIAEADLVVVNRPARERRAPSASVMAVLGRHRQDREILVADVTRPLREWAGGFAERLEALAGGRAASSEDPSAVPVESR
jgi:hypothetical protein